jgi:hypothetical protein
MKLIENADGTLILQREGEPDVPDARLRRAFPWSKASEFISVRDEKGKERAIIRSLSDLDADQRRIVER